MSKKKIPKASKKRLAIFGTISVLIIIYFLVQLCIYAFKIYDLNNDLKKSKIEYKNLKIEEKDLRNEIDKLKDSDYIARYARENYSYSKNGEYIIKINEAKEKEEKDESLVTVVKNYILNINIDYQYIIYGFIVLTVIIIIMKSKKKS